MHTAAPPDRTQNARLAPGVGERRLSKKDWPSPHSIARRRVQARSLPEGWSRASCYEGEVADFLTDWGEAIVELGSEPHARYEARAWLRAMHAFAAWRAEA